MSRKGLFHKKVFVVEAQGEKKRSLSLSISNDGGTVSSYSKVDSITSKGCKGFLIVHHSLFQNLPKLTEAVRQCEQHHLTPLRSEYIDYAVSNRSANILSKFLISWDECVPLCEQGKGHKAIKGSKQTKNQAESEQYEETKEPSGHNKLCENADADTSVDDDDDDDDDDDGDDDGDDGDDDSDDDSESVIFHGSPERDHTPTTTTEPATPSPCKTNCYRVDDEIAFNYDEPVDVPSTCYEVRQPIASETATVLLLESSTSKKPRKREEEEEEEPAAGHNRASDEPTTCQTSDTPVPTITTTSTTIPTSPTKRPKPTPQQRSPTEPAIDNTATTTNSPPTTVPKKQHARIPATTPRRPKAAAIQPTPRRTSERIRTHILYNQTATPRSVKKPSPSYAKAKSRRTRASSTDGHEKEESEVSDNASDEDEEVDVDTIDTKEIKSTIPKPIQPQTKPLPASIEDKATPNKTPRRATKTSKTPKTAKTKTTTKEEAPPSPTPFATPSSMRATPKATPTPRKTLSKTPRARLIFEDEIEDPLQYIIHSLAHDAGQQIEVTGRESEFSQLFNFCKECITNRKAGSAYLCGKPGTGKTLTVSTAVNAVLQWTKSESHKKPDVITVNCTQVADPKSIYKSILEKSRRYAGGSLANAEKELESIVFSDGPMTLLVLDEIDQLMNHQSMILYNLFEWSAAAHSTLILIGIANTLDLVQRSLSLLTKGAIAPVIIAYKPYTHAQLTSVITARVAKADVIDPAAIQVIARKVAAIDGDIRKALDICVDAAKHKQIQVGSTGGSKRIGVADMVAAIGRNYPTEIVEQIKRLPLHYQAVLCGAVVLTQSFTQEELLQSYTSICKKARIPPIMKSEFNDIVSGLAGYNLLHITQRAKQQERISVPLTKEDLIEGMDSTLHAIKVILEQHCQQLLLQQSDPER